VLQGTGFNVVGYVSTSRRSSFLEAVRGGSHGGEDVIVGLLVLEPCRVAGVVNVLDSMNHVLLQDDVLRGVGS
jgi:hypothetical protein